MKKKELTCMDCSRKYKDFGFDVLLLDWQWILVNPDENGVLCANCILDRMAKLNKTFRRKNRFTLAKLTFME